MTERALYQLTDQADTICCQILHILVYILIQVGSPIESVADVSGPPLILASGLRGKLSQVFVVIEGQTSEVSSLLAALDRAFKVHYMFNISYSDKASHIWQLVQKLGYNIQDSTTTFACVHDFQRFFMVNKRARLS